MSDPPRLDALLDALQGEIAGALGPERAQAVEPLLDDLRRLLAERPQEGPALIGRLDHLEDVLEALSLAPR